MSHEACEWCGAPDGSVVHRVRHFDTDPGPHVWSASVPGYRKAKTVHVAIWAACAVCLSQWQVWPRLLS